MILKKLRPYYGRISVLESPVDEEQRDSGLIVHIDTDHGIKRGVVANVDRVEGDPSEEYMRERIVEGTVVYYLGGVKISDLTFITSSEIIAYEEG